MRGRDQTMNFEKESKWTVSLESTLERGGDWNGTKKSKRSQEKMDKSSYNVAQKIFQLTYKEKQLEFYPKKMVICISKYKHISRYRYSNDNQVVETHMMLHKQMSRIAKLSRIAHIKRFL